MWKTLLNKMLTSRKFVVLASTFLLKLVAPAAGKYGVDMTPLSDALNEWLPVIIAWVLGQSAVDTAKELYLPPPPPDATGVPGNPPTP